MLKKLLQFTLSLILILGFQVAVSSEELAPIADLPITENTLQSSIPIEVKRPTTLDNQIVDPNFNTLRTSDTNKPIAVILVVGLLVIATVVPLVTWRYFSR